jgi:integrase
MARTLKLDEVRRLRAGLRETLDPLGFTWLTNHSFRKTAATLLDDSGLTVQEIADQLGRKRMS